jgi:hypothetical protein
VGWTHRSAIFVLLFAWLSSWSVGMRSLSRVGDLPFSFFLAFCVLHLRSFFPFVDDIITWEINTQTGVLTEYKNNKFWRTMENMPTSGHFGVLLSQSCHFSIRPKYVFKPRKN